MPYTKEETHLKAIQSWQRIFLRRDEKKANPDLSLAAKGAAAVMFSYADLHCTSDELSKLLGVSENRAIAICHKLRNAGYGSMFRMSSSDELHD